MIVLPMEAYNYIIDAKANEKPILRSEAPEHIKELVRKANARIISLGGEAKYIIEGEE